MTDRTNNNRRTEELELTQEQSQEIFTQMKEGSLAPFAFATLGESNNYYTSSMEDFIDNKKPDLEFECPEHYIGRWRMETKVMTKQECIDKWGDAPKVPRVQPTGYKVSTLSNKQNKPVKTVETREVIKK